jgi:hypothetical protein
LRRYDGTVAIVTATTFATQAANPRTSVDPSRTVRLTTVVSAETLRQRAIFPHNVRPSNARASGRGGSDTGAGGTVRVSTATAESRMSASMTGVVSTVGGPR